VLYLRRRCVGRADPMGPTTKHRTGPLFVAVIIILKEIGNWRLLSRSNPGTDPGLCTQKCNF